MVSVLSIVYYRPTSMCASSQGIFQSHSFQFPIYNKRKDAPPSTATIPATAGAALAAAPAAFVAEAAAEEALDVAAITVVDPALARPVSVVDPTATLIYLHYIS
jgi:hypothetical protein